MARDVDSLFVDLDGHEDRNAVFGSIPVEYGIEDEFEMVPRDSVLEGRRRFLCFFLHRHLSFRLAEFQSVAQLLYKNSHGVDGLPTVVWEEPAEGLVASSFWYFHIPNEDGQATEMARLLANQCFLVRSILDVWGEGSTMKELHEQVASFDPCEKESYSKGSFKLQVEGWGVTLSQEQKVSIIDSFSESLKDLKGPICLKDPKNIFWVIVARPSKNSMVANVKPWHCLAREVAVNQTKFGILAKYELKKRRYLGPTSMDAELAFLMSNMCHVRKSSFVIDPFVGTGGLLIPAAAMGAVTMGMDIDMRVIKIGKMDKKARPVNVWTNFDDYGLMPPVGLLRADLARNPFRDGMESIFHAILADPPYGVRAGGRKSKCEPDMLINSRDDHIAGTSPYPLAECLRDLLDWAAKVLVKGGRLGYWIPSLPDSGSKEIPFHPNLVLKYNCEQVLGGRYNRRLIVMEKVTEYNDKEVEEYFTDNPHPNKMTIDDLWDLVYAPADPNSRNKQATFRSKNV